MRRKIGAVAVFAGFIAICYLAGRFLTTEWRVIVLTSGFLIIAGTINRVNEKRSREGREPFDLFGVTLSFGFGHGDGIALPPHTPTKPEDKKPR
jgi:hypothetical protein